MDLHAEAEDCVFVGGIEELVVTKYVSYVSFRRPLLSIVGELQRLDAGPVYCKGCRSKSTSLAFLKNWTSGQCNLWISIPTGCCHSLCELCYQSLLGGGRRCPLDQEELEEEQVARLPFNLKQLERQHVRCPNSKYGCVVIGTVREVQSHFLQECIHYAATCDTCKANVLRRDIASHYATECQRDSPFVSLPKLPFRGNLFDVAKKTFDLVESIQEKLSNFESQLNSCTGEIQESVQEMTVSNEQLLNRVLEDVGRVAAGIGNTESKVTQQAQDQNQIQGSLRRVIELLSTFELQISSINGDDVTTSVKTVNENVEQVNERVGNLTDMLQQISATLNDVEGIKGELNPLLQCSEELTKFMNADDEAREKSPLVKAILGTSEQIGSVAERVYTLYSCMVAHNTEAFFHIVDFAKALEKDVKRFSVERKSDVFVLCGYSVRLHVDYSLSRFISVGFALCKSPSDSLVKWPFRIPFTCRFVHPSERDFVCPTLHPNKHDSKGGRYEGAFGRPTNVENQVVYIEGYTPVPTLKDRGFIHTDSLCIGIRLHPDMA
ncbi:TNF receptor-associated factor 5-like [Ornithodoros turicata]|uniref:TNF receptor-associated factor 5-like n=1 Tax=Ornithodoros turicata TaxID=34597 RepID=UPI003138850C